MHHLYIGQNNTKKRFDRKGNEISLDAKIRKRALRAAEIALDKKALDTVILEFKDVSTIADYFIICSGENPAQIRAIADAVDEFFSKEKIHPMGREGLDSGRWVLIDYGDIVVNIFSEEAREYYDLEKLWMDAPRVPLEEHSLEAESHS